MAIASLGGPMSAVGVVQAGVVKHAEAGYEAAAPTRDLRRQVSSGIRQWAGSEKFTTPPAGRTTPFYGVVIRMLRVRQAAWKMLPPPTLYWFDRKTPPPEGSGLAPE